jgi:hypothetical protein
MKYASWKLHALVKHRLQQVDTVENKDWRFLGKAKSAAQMNIMVNAFGAGFASNAAKDD